MTVKKISIALDEDVARAAGDAAHRAGMSLSAWLNGAAERALIVDAGLIGVREWEAEHGELTDDELAWADRVLDAGVIRQTS